MNLHPDIAAVLEGRSQWAVVTGDCLSVLPTLPAGCVDAVVTSPPYNTLPSSHNPGGIHGERASGVNKWIDKAAKGYFDQRPEDEYQEWLREIVDECIRACRGMVWVNHKIRYRDGVAIHPVRMFSHPIYSEVVWDRGGSMALNCKRYSPSHEVLLGFGTPHVWNDNQNSLMSVWRIPAVRDEGANSEHPCPFPLEIARRPIVSCTCAGDLVLDPFLGSGTTVAVARELGRHGVGIELNPAYAELARVRIGKAEKPQTFVDHRAPAPAGLFAEGNS